MCSDSANAWKNGWRSPSDRKSAVGGKSSHAAVVARGMGVPCIVACSAIAINERGKTATIKAATMDPNPNSPAFAKFMKMAGKFRGTFGVRANAADAFGAEGIGLCRTEHMFFAEDRLPFVQAMILTDNVKDRTKALAKLLPMQRKDFAGLFETMNGFPVVIRTLDPPLHEFVPKREELMVDLAKLPTADIKAKKEMLNRHKNFAPDVKSLKTVIPMLLARVEQLHEFNPHARPPWLPSRHHLSGDH